MQHPRPGLCPLSAAPLFSPQTPCVAWELPASFHPQLPQEPEQQAFSWLSRAFPPQPPSCPGRGAHTSQTCLYFTDPRGCKAGGPVPSAAQE